MYMLWRINLTLFSLFFFLDSVRLLTAVLLRQDWPTLDASRSPFFRRLPIFRGFAPLRSVSAPPRTPQNGCRTSQDSMSSPPPASPPLNIPWEIARRRRSSQGRRASPPLPSLTSSPRLPSSLLSPNRFQPLLQQQQPVGGILSEVLPPQLPFPTRAQWAHWSRLRCTQSAAGNTRELHRHRSSNVGRRARRDERDGARVFAAPTKSGALEFNPWAEGVPVGELSASSEGGDEWQPGASSSITESMTTAEDFTTTRSVTTSEEDSSGSRRHLRKRNRNGGVAVASEPTNLGISGRLRNGVGRSPTATDDPPYGTFSEDEWDEEFDDDPSEMEGCDADEEGEDDYPVEMVISTDIDKTACKCELSRNDCDELLNKPGLVLELRELFAGLAKGAIKSRLRQDLHQGVTVLTDKLNIFSGFAESIKVNDRYYVCGNTYREVMRVAKTTWHKYMGLTQKKKLLRMEEAASLESTNGDLPVPACRPLSWRFGHAEEWFSNVAKHGDRLPTENLMEEEKEKWRIADEGVGGGGGRRKSEKNGRRKVKKLNRGNRNLPLKLLIVRSFWVYEWANRTRARAALQDRPTNGWIYLCILDVKHAAAVRAHRWQRRRMIWKQGVVRATLLCRITHRASSTCSTQRSLRGIIKLRMKSHWLSAGG